jgi:hypothetical protein
MSGSGAVSGVFSIPSAQSVRAEALRVNGTPSVALETCRVQRRSVKLPRLLVTLMPWPPNRCRCLRPATTSWWDQTRYPPGDRVV